MFMPRIDRIFDARSRLLGGIALGASCVAGLLTSLLISGASSTAVQSAGQAETLALRLALVEPHSSADTFASPPSRAHSGATGLRLRSIGSSHAVVLQPSILVSADDALTMAGWATAVQHAVRRQTGDYVARIEHRAGTGAQIRLAAQAGEPVLDISGIWLRSGRYVALGSDAAPMAATLHAIVSSESCRWLGQAAQLDGRSVCAAPTALAMTSSNQ